MKLSTSRSGLACLVLSTSLLVTPVSATVTMYTNEAAFRAATTGLQTIDLNNVAPYGAYVLFGKSVVFSGTLFSSYFPIYVVDPANAPILFNYGTGGVMTAQHDLTMSFSSNPTAVATYVNTRLYKKDTLYINLSTGDSYTLATNGGASNGFQFVGFVSDSGPINSVSMTTNIKNYLVVDNVLYGARK
jgi:hypothetical protein